MSYDTAILADSPILYARFDEPSGTNAADSSTNANAGTWSSAPTWGVTGPITGDPTNKAVTTAASQHLKFPNIAAYAVGDTVSLEAWVKTATAAANGVISFGQTSGPILAGAYMRTNAAGSVDMLQSHTNRVSNGTTAVNNGNWHHIVVTKTGATRKVYIDSSDNTTLQTNSTLDTIANGIYVAGDVLNASFQELFTGSIARPAVYATALSLARVQAHYVAATAVSSVELVGAVPI